MSQPPLPPFTLESASQKVRLAEDGWNSEQGLMHTRIASINDLPIAEPDRLFHWPAGRRPDDPASLSEWGL